MNESIKTKEIEILDKLVKRIYLDSKVIFEQQHELDKDKKTSEANESFELNSREFQDIMYQCMSKLAVLSYNLKNKTDTPS